jgi:pyridoxal 5'-phosphate synthase glutaminase subunit Pdx2
MVDKFPPKKLKIGVLALQGCVDPHLHILSLFNDVEAFKVREARDLYDLDGLILPGGESTTMLKLIKSRCMFSELKSFCTSKASWGICAGSILLAKEVVSSTKGSTCQESLGAIDICAVRNAYGSQQESFTTELTISLSEAIPEKAKPLGDFSLPYDLSTKTSFSSEFRFDQLCSIPVDFIRAPKITSLQAVNKLTEKENKASKERSLITIAKFNGEPVGFIQGKVMATAFHTEIISELGILGYVLEEHRSLKAGVNSICNKSGELSEFWKIIRKKTALYSFFLNCLVDS